VRPEDAARPAEAAPEGTQRQRSAEAPQTDAPDGKKLPQGEPGNAGADAQRVNTETGHADAEAGSDVRDRQPSDPARSTAEPADASTGKRASTDARAPISPDAAPQDQPSGAEYSRDGSTADSLRSTIPEDTISSDSDPAQPKADGGNEGRTPTSTDSGTNIGSSPRTASPDQPAQTTPTAPRGPGVAASPGQPSSPSPSALPPPRTPPLSVEQSQRLIDNVSKMPPEARLHPQVQADVAQARRVVAGGTAPTTRFEAAPPSASTPGAQASGSGQASPTTSGLARPALPAATGRIGDIETRLQGAAAEWNKLRQDFETAQSNHDAAALNGTNAEFLKARKALVKAKKALDQMIETARRHVEIPKHEQGQVTFGSVDSRLRAAVEAGARLATRYTHATLLPSVDVAYRSSDRPAYRDGVIRMDESATESEIMHEVTHGTEVQNPAVLAAAVAFLRHRAGTERPKLLRDLTGDRQYRLDEYAYEDQFAARGGVHYMGKDYGGRATELLTRGIERLHADPVEFMQNDPEYFRFILQTLQQP